MFRSWLAVLILGAGMISAPLIAPWAAIEDCRNAAPLPRDVALVAPRDEVSGELARFAGVWNGNWAEGLCATLVVEKVMANGFAQAVYGYGVSISEKVDLPGNFRGIGRVFDGELRLRTPWRGLLRFRVEADGGLSMRDQEDLLGRAERIESLSQVGCRPAGAENPRPPGDTRGRITAEDLGRPDYPDRGPVHNAYFMAVGESGPALHAFEGRLSLAPSKIFSARDGCPGLPGETLAYGFDFVTLGDHLVPVERDVISPPGSRGLQEIILSPGRVWSEPGDGGRSRASFPFLVTSQVSGAALNGLATFLYDDTTVSAVRFQIVQETAAWRRADLWGQVPASYRPGGLAEAAEVKARFEEELAARLPVRPWSDLDARLGRARAAAFAGEWGREHLSAAGLVFDGQLYLYGCPTRYGPFPYCRRMRHSAYSVSKSIGAGLSLFRLAEKYGESVLALEVKDYLEITATHDGWDQVTFADALSMAVGVGNGPARTPLTSQETDDPPGFFRALSGQEKLGLSFSFYGDYPWGPGEVMRYNNSHTFVLAAAMEALLRSREGPDARIWDMVRAEVLKPIGVNHLPLRHTREEHAGQGVPWFYSGAYPTIEDAAKIAQLLQNDGRHGTDQLLSAAVVREALGRSDVFGLPTGYNSPDGEGRYHLSFWSQAYRDRSGCLNRIPSMTGYGGNLVALMPNGVTALRFADSFNYERRGMIEAAEALAPFCDPAKSEDAAVASAGRLMPVAEVREALAGHTYYAEDWHVYSAPDGVTYSASPKEFWLGRWRIDQQGHYCSRYSTWRGGAETCFAVVETDAGLELHADDRFWSIRIDLRDGNPEAY